ncbi:MAG: DNA-binding protein [Burkholderiaceae bacterium]|nr:DNA-binding protein [Burkholderiaceae bacterium]
MATRTPDDVRAEFLRKGISITSWAISHGFTPNLVFEVLAERKKCLRGQSHKIAVLLGLKQGEIADPKSIDSRLAA